MADKDSATQPKVMTEQNVSRKGRGWQECQTTFNFSRHLIPLLQDCPFYSSISRHIKKRFTYDIPTAAVAYDPRVDEVVMFINPAFLSGGTYTDASGKQVTCKPLTNWQIRGVIEHELNHVVFGHIAARHKQPAGDWNVAADLANNSLIVARGGQPRDLQPGEVALPLPELALIPGQMPHIDPERFAELPARDQEATLRRCKLIEGFPTMKASEWYFSKLLDDRKENGDDGEVYAIGSLDSHDGWEDVPDDLREFVESKVKGIVEQAVKHADQQSDGWGSIPVDIQQEIRRSVSNIVNWRAVLRQFIGGLVRGTRTTSIRKINRKYPYIHAGIKRGYTAKLLVAVDESGSVSDDMLEMFFAELDGLTRKVSITLCHFDCDATEKDLYEWKKGMRPQLKRLKSGGTNFDAPTRLVNDPKNRGRWDGVLVCTDGCADRPVPSRVKRGWVLGQGCKLYFGETDELVIELSKERAMTGAWR